MINVSGRKEKKHSPSQEIFESIRNFQPSKSETFTYVTFSDKQLVKSDGKTTMRSRASSTSLDSTSEVGRSQRSSKTCQVRYVSSKIGSLDNITHSPGGGKVKITGKKLDFSHVQAKCGSLQNKDHVPNGGRVKIVSKKPDFSNVQPKIASKTNHSPGGGKVKIISKKPDFSNVQPKIASKTNHSPGGGKVKIINQKKDYSKVQSKCGSLDNAKHQPGGGDVEILHEPIIYKSLKKNTTAKPSVSVKGKSLTKEIDPGRSKTPQIATFHGS